MPKMKPHSGARKRFKVSGTGKVRHRKSYKGHAMAAKNGRRVRRLSVKGSISAPDQARIKKLLGI